MKTYFVDTNLFIRYLTNDDIEKANRVEELLDKAALCKVRLITCEVVLAEVVWVLESYYNLNKVQIAEHLEAILATPGLNVLNGKVVEKAVAYYLNENIDFIDAYIVSLMNKLNISSIYSFDKNHLKRIKSIKRLEP
ncbi:MAG: type II toxin-antitoxin system VapC family toxin [Thermodesulfobacteriota bacterium]|nr:type II toxin-antitoxin system VapC family toxin [Thermodesulfobacteriota bacterium]